MQRLPQFAHGYCYGARVIYVDKKMFVPLAQDLFASDMKLWKGQMTMYSPQDLPDQKGYFVNQAQGITNMWDFQNYHASQAINLSRDANSRNRGIPVQYQDAGRYATPAGMSQIMR